VLRFLTGLGLGGAMPNAVSLASEYAPKRLQPMFVSAIFVGMAGGAFVASAVGGVLMPVWGWRAVFVVGGLLPIALALLLIMVLPESLRFLAVVGADRERIAAIVRRIAPDAAHVPLAPPPVSERREGLPVKHLFTEGRAGGTLLLWIPFFMNLLILYFVLSWLPSLIVGAGMPVSSGITAVAAFSIGGIVGTLLGSAIAMTISAFTPIPAAVELWSVALGIGITAAVGLFFGLYPAMRAARLDPIEALRRE